MIKVIVKRIDMMQTDITSITQSLGAIHEAMVIMRDRLKIQELR